MLQRTISSPRQRDHDAKEAQAVRTLERGLEVLRAFHGEPRPLGNKAISARTGLPKPTVTRITHTLVSLGYLTRMPSSGEFCLGGSVLGLGRAFLEMSEIRAAARLPMQQLASRLDLSVGLAVPDRGQMLCILVYRSPKNVALGLHAGTLLPMHCTATGRAYLWALPTERRRVELARIRKEAGGKAIESIERAFDDLDGKGYCVAIGEFKQNMFGVAVPLVLGEQRRIMALSCGGATFDLGEAALRQRIAPEILMTAALIRHALGEPALNGAKL
jgi:DNA-binding IclR family transcriptional regulator